MRVAARFNARGGLQVNQKAIKVMGLTEITSKMQTVNLLAYAFDGSNPSPTTILAS
jgi:hypothetical protein